MKLGKGISINKGKILETTLKKTIVLSVLFQCGSSGSNIGKGWKKYLQQGQQAYLIALIILFILSSSLPASSSSGRKE